MPFELFSTMLYGYMIKKDIDRLLIDHFSDDGPTPFGYLEDGEFGNCALIQIPNSVYAEIHPR